MAEGSSSTKRGPSQQQAKGQDRSVSDSFIAEEHSNGRPVANHDLHHESDIYPASLNSSKAPNTVIAIPPHLKFNHVDQGSSVRRAVSSTSALSSSDRLRPLTPIHNKNRSDAFFTTSPANSEPGSPALPPTNIDANMRSASNTTFNRHARSHAPPTPTRTRGRYQYGRSSSQPGSPQSRKPFSHSQPGSPQSRKPFSHSRPGTPHPHGKPSVKHLTCFWWKEKGNCRFDEKDCLYAHHDTGLYADPPRQVMPGEPALAGRSLDRALKQYHNKSSSSLKSMSSDLIVNTYVSSRPGTPANGGPASPELLYEQLKDIESACATLKSDNTFLRGLVEQGTKEKAVLITSIENLQAESNTLKNEKAQVEKERDHLRSLVGSQRQTALSNPFGAIGSRVSLGGDGQLERQNSNLKELLRNYGVSP